LIIALNQLNFMFGLSGIPRDREFYMNVYHSLASLGRSNWWAFGFFILNFVPLMLLIRFFNKIPWPIVFAGIGCLFGWLSKAG
jgi:hypothetical protein